jgi:excisionase family DNA binding protein
MAPAYETPFDDLEPCSVLRAEEIARRLGVSARSIRRAIARGELKASRACGLRVLAADAAAWWTARVVVRVEPERSERRSPAPSAPEVGSEPWRRSSRFARGPADQLPLPPRTGGA